MTSTAQIDFVLEPLSRATRSILTPPTLRDTDHMFIWLNHDGSEFICELRTLHKCERCFAHERGDGPKGFVRTGVLSDECHICEGAGFQQPSYPYPSFESEDFFKRIPECKHLGKRNPEYKFRWGAATTDFTALLIKQCWPEDRLHFRQRTSGLGVSDSRLVYDTLLLRFASQTKRAADVAEFKLNKKLPTTPEHWIEHETHKPAAYQTAAACFVTTTSGAIFADPGTGKTFIAQQVVNTVANKAKANGDKTLKILVVCPPQVCYNWFLEIQRFAAVPGKVVVMRGDKRKRLKAFYEGIKKEPNCAFTIIITSYDSAKRDVEELCLAAWDYCFADESHFFKDPTTARFACMEALRDASKVRVPMTGSPIGNSLLDLWTQLEFIEEGGSGFQKYPAFRKYHGVFQELGDSRGIEKLVAVKNIAMLQERLSRVAFSITKKEAGLNLPDKVYDVWEVTMTAQQAKTYDRVKAEILVELEDKLAQRADRMTIEHALTTLLRLAQITSGFVTWDGVADPDTGTVLVKKRVEQISVKNPKIIELIDLITAPDRDPKGKTIIWACFVEDLEKIGEALTAAGVGFVSYYGATKQKDRDPAVASFNKDPQCKVFLGNPSAAGAGLDLLGYDKLEPDSSDTYADHVIFFSQGWSALLRTQAEDRAHRRGTRMPVRITDLVVPNTIDVEIRQRVHDKIKNAGLVLDVQDELRGILEMLK